MHISAIYGMGRIRLGDVRGMLDPGAYGEAVAGVDHGDCDRQIRQLLTQGDELVLEALRANGTYFRPRQF